MRPDWLAMGFNEDDAPYLRAYEAQFRALGWSRDRIQRTLQWARGLSGVKTYEELQDRFRGFAATERLSEADLSSAMALHKHIATHGPESIPLPHPPSPQADEQRFAELQEMMRDRTSPYWRNEALQIEHYEILERRHGGGGEPAREVRVPSALPAPVSAPPSSTSGLSRKEELTEMMRNRNSAYWRNENLQSEYRAIIESEQGAPQQTATESQ